MTLKCCRVSFTDLNGSRHSVEVVAESLYEAAALGLKALQSADFVDPSPGDASRLEVEVNVASVCHTVTVHQLKRWIESGSSDPREGLKKQRLADAIGEQRK